MRRRLEPALSQALEPGDEVVAEAVGLDGPWQLVTMMIFFLIAATTMIMAQSNFGAASEVLMYGGVVYVFLQVRQPAFCLAATRRALIVYRIGRFTGRPIRLAFTAPLPTVTVSTAQRRGQLGRAVQVSVPGQRTKRLRLLSRSRAQDRTDMLMAALLAGGARVIS
jgi:hypothetical protein